MELNFLRLVREQESEFKAFASTKGTRRVATITSLCEKERENIIRITTGEGTKMKQNTNQVQEELLEQITKMEQIHASLPKIKTL